MTHTKHSLRRGSIAGNLHVEARVLQVSDQRQRAPDGVWLGRAQHGLGGLDECEVSLGVQFAGHAVLSTCEPFELHLALEVVLLG